MQEMDQLREVILILVAVGAVLSVTGLALGLYQVRAGRLTMRWLAFLQSPLRKVPATPEDTRRNGWSVALNGLAVLLLDVMILAGLLLPSARRDAALAISYGVVSLAGFAAVFMAILTAARIRRDVHYLPRKTAALMSSAPGPPAD